VFTVGEVFKDDARYCAEYQGVMDSLLNFPLQAKLSQTIKEGGSMMILSDYFGDEIKAWPDHTVITNFISNHDLNRVLSEQPADKEAFKANYAFLLSTVGIPALYYGDEQMFTGGKDPANREVLWGKRNKDAEMYKYVRDINFLRFRTQFYKFEQVERMADDNFYAFTRGPVFFAFTNTQEEQVRTIKSHDYPAGTVLCNAVDSKECVPVVNGEFAVKITGKLPKILVPAVGKDSNGGLGTALKRIKETISDTIKDATLISGFGAGQSSDL
jgi:alpha-amylase